MEAKAWNQIRIYICLRQISSFPQFLQVVPKCIFEIRRQKVIELQNLISDQIRERRKRERKKKLRKGKNSRCFRLILVGVQSISSSKYIFNADHHSLRLLFEMSWNIILLPTHYDKILEEWKETRYVGQREALWFGIKSKETDSEKRWIVKIDNRNQENQPRRNYTLLIHFWKLGDGLEYSS